MKYFFLISLILFSCTSVKKSIKEEEPAPVKKAEGDLVSSENWARKVLENDPENIEALFVMMRVFFEKEEYAAARLVAKNALELSPKNGSFYLWQGHILSKLGMLGDALDSYANAVEFEPNPESLEFYGLLLLKRGKNKEALDILERLTNLVANNDKNYLHLGNAYLANKNWLMAKESYEKALRINPENKDINFNLGLLYYENKMDEINEIDRLKIAKNNFDIFLEQKNITKERRQEATDYIKAIERKIELLEYKEEVPE